MDRNYDEEGVRLIVLLKVLFFIILYGVLGFGTYSVGMEIMRRKFKRACKEYNEKHSYSRYKIDKYISMEKMDLHMALIFASIFWPVGIPIVLLAVKISEFAPQIVDKIIEKVDV